MRRIIVFVYCAGTACASILEEQGHWKADLKPEPRNSSLIRLLDAHGERLFASLSRLTSNTHAAHELFQELFVRLGKSDGFASASDPGAFAFRTAINLAMEWRRKRRELPLSLHSHDVAAANVSPLHSMIQAERMDQILSEASLLSELARQAFVLRLIEQESYAEIAAKLDRTPQQVRGLCHAALKRIRSRLNAREPGTHSAKAVNNHV